MKARQPYLLVLMLGLAVSLCGGMRQFASAQPQGPPIGEQCEQAKLKADAAETNANAAERNARAAEEMSYQASREAKAAEFKAADAEAISLAPDPGEARRDPLRRLKEWDRARELAEEARIRADARRKDAQKERDYANQLRLAADKLRGIAQDLCARQQATE